jgi:hypothetical protein
MCWWRSIFLLDFNLKSILKQLKNRFLYMCVLHMSHILQICQLFQNTCDIIICTTLARLLMENNKDVICVEHNMCYICKNKFAVNMYKNLFFNCFKMDFKLKSSKKNRSPSAQMTFLCSTSFMFTRGMVCCYFTY